MSVNEDKLFWIDSLKALAMIGVILLHVSAPILYQYGSISTFYWWLGNIVDGTVRFCVPVFLMVTGALILPKTYTFLGFFKKKVSRILYPFMCWSLIYILIELASIRTQNTPISSFEMINVITQLIKNGASYHLWYVYLIIGIYLTFPFLNKWIVNATQQEVGFYILIWFVLILFKMPFLSIINSNSDLATFCGYLGYPILGYYLTKVEINKKVKWVALVFTAISVFITIIGTFILTKKNGVFVGSFYSYLSFNVILSAVGIFLLLRNCEVENELARKAVIFISRYSYGIYLSHVLILIGCSQIGISWEFIHPIIGIPVTTILCLLISSCFVYLISILPYGHFISG